MKVLIADDDWDIREMVKRMMKWEGIACKVYECGSQVIREVVRNTKDYDCVILDYQMGGLDGIQTAKMIKSISDIPIILITANTSIETEVNAKIAGIDYFLRKPFTNSSLISAIRDVVK